MSSVRVNFLPLLLRLLCGHRLQLSSSNPRVTKTFSHAILAILSSQWLLELQIYSYYQNGSRLQIPAGHLAFLSSPLLSPPLLTRILYCNKPAIHITNHSVQRMRSHCPWDGYGQKLESTERSKNLRLHGNANVSIGEPPAGQCAVLGDRLGHDAVDLPSSLTGLRVGCASP